MHRQATTSRAVEPPQTSHLRSLKGKMEETTDLPLYNRNSGVNKKEISRSRLAEKLVHLIPVVVLLCFFILWWFSHPVDLEEMNGKIAAAYRLMAQNTTFFDLIFTPYPSIPEVQLVGNDSIAD